MKTKINKAIIATGSIATLTLLFGCILSSTLVSADDVVDNVSVTVPVSCTMSGSGMDSHSANIVNGTYQANIGTTIMNATCNDSEGFSIYANGFTNDTLGNNKLVGTSTSQEIITGTATTAGDSDISNWTMKLSTDSQATYPITLSDGYDAFHTVPSEWTKVATRTTGTDAGANATGASLTTTYAAYISKTQTADAYSGKVIYILVHPNDEAVPFIPSSQSCESGNICYYSNADPIEITGQMGQQRTVGSTNNSEITNNARVTLWASNFKRDGYGFAGWNDKYDYTGTNYGPNETINAPTNIETKGLSLYANWVESTGSMQEFNNQRCQSLNTNEVIALTDERDGNTYAISRLADGRCWMVENLRFGNTAVELNALNTNNPSLPLTNDYTNNITSNKLSASLDIANWCDEYSPTCEDQSMLNTDNTTKFTLNTSSEQNGNIYSYGNYYNWYSATAGHGKYGTTPSTNNDGTPGDICPYGWRLPTGGRDESAATGDYGILDIALGGEGTSIYRGTARSNMWRSYPNNYVLSGYFVRTSSSEARSFSAHYWTSTTQSKYYGQLLYYYAPDNYPYQNFGPGNGDGYKYEANTVRCLINS